MSILLETVISIFLSYSKTQVLPHGLKGSWVGLACVVVPHLSFEFPSSWKGLEGANEAEVLRYLKPYSHNF